MEKDEFTSWFDQEEFLWSEEESHVGFMKCHVQKRFQSDVYVNCKPVHRSKCVPVNNFEISKECLSKIKKQKLISNNTAKSAINWWMIYVSRHKRSLIKLNRNLWNFLTICTIFFMNFIKQCKITLHLSEKAFREYFNEIFTGQQQIHMQFWTAFKSLPRDSLGNKSNCDHPKTTTVM